MKFSEGWRKCDFLVLFPGGTALPRIEFNERVVDNASELSQMLDILMCSESDSFLFYLESA